MIVADLQVLYSTRCIFKYCILSTGDSLSLFSTIDLKRSLTVFINYTPHGTWGNQFVEGVYALV